MKHRNLKAIYLLTYQVNASQFFKMMPNNKKSVNYRLLFYLRMFLTLCNGLIGLHSNYLNYFGLNFVTLLLLDM